MSLHVPPKTLYVLPPAFTVARAGPQWTRIDVPLTTRWPGSQAAGVPPEGATQTVNAAAVAARTTPGLISGTRL